MILFFLSKFCEVWKDKIFFMLRDIELVLKNMCSSVLKSLLSFVSKISNLIRIRFWIDKRVLSFYLKSCLKKFLVFFCFSFVICC